VRDETFITLSQGFATHQDGKRVFEQAGFEPKVAMQVNDIFTLLSMVSSGWVMRCCRAGLRRCTRTG
jgi:LysR family malonate utilization transcriptional regulator